MRTLPVLVALANSRACVLLLVVGEEIWSLSVGSCVCGAKFGFVDGVGVGVEDDKPVRSFDDRAGLDDVIRAWVGRYVSEGTIIEAIEPVGGEAIRLREEGALFFGHAVETGEDSGG